MILYDRRGQFGQSRPDLFSRKESGVALIFTLALIVLVTVAVLAFFSFATSNRRVEASRANRSKAELLSLSAESYALGLLVDEITNPSYSNAVAIGGQTIYQPTSAVYARPRRLLTPGVSLSDPVFYNLIRQSVPSADPNASNDGTDLPAKNGRSLDSVRWNIPKLLSSTGFASTNQLPHWIYVDRIKGITSVPSPNVIGRFAFNMYDLGGLLNVNATGYPPSLSADLLSYLKGGEGGADLSLLDSPSVQPVNIDSLLAFRYPDTPAPSAFVGRMLGASSKGFLSTLNQDFLSGDLFKHNMFASRQDLIRYVRLKNPNFTGSLPYLTHFSRSVNAPSWKPPLTPANTNPDILNIRFAAAGSVTHYNDKGVASTYQIKVGDPLVQRRFSLAKLAWLTSTGPAPGISDAAILSSFGLKWNGTNERWDYVGSSSIPTPSAISSLGQVAIESSPREPNFFELLKSGILSGSLGGSAVGKSVGPTGIIVGSVSAAGNIPVDANKDLHVLKIGADIIDCADSDNYPTILSLSFGSVAVERAGVEDLPYFFTVDTGIIFVMTPLTPPVGGKTHNLQSCDFIWVPELLNPHRLSVSSTGPASISMDISSGFLTQVGFGSNTTFSPTISAQPNKDLSVLPPIKVSSANYETYRNNPQPVRDASAANKLGTTVPAADTSIRDVLAFHIFSYGNPAEYHNPFPVNIQADSKLAIAEVNSVIFRLRYLTPGGNLKTYATLGGNESLPLDTGIDGVYLDDFLFPILKHSDSLANMSSASKLPKNITINSPYLFAWDPRSSRYGPGIGRYHRPLAEAPLFKVTTGADAHGIVYPALFYPNIFYSANTPPLTGFMGNLPQYASFKDPDGTVRLPDANIGWTSTGTTPTAANPYKNLAVPDGRPVILQRPYRSVAELGYVFRDVPWQTIDFFNDQGGDAALLDFFSVTDEPAVTAGRVDLNTMQVAVRKALLSQSAQLADETLPLTTTQLTAVSTALDTQAFAAGQAKATIPANIADLPVFMASSDASNAFTLSNLGTIKYRREAVVRALASSQTRTWNVLVDVVAQAGRFPSSKVSPGEFVVEGECRSWNSVAVDRYTGKIVDQQNEKVNE